MPGQTVQTQIRLLLEEQSDQGLHNSNFRVIITNVLGVRIFRKFTVVLIFVLQVNRFTSAYFTWWPPWVYKMYDTVSLVKFPI